MNNIRSFFSVAAILPLFAVGCSSSRDVEVSGQVEATGASTVHIDFYDQLNGANKLAKSIDQDKPGAFTATVSLEAEKVRVVAIGDSNKNGKCDSGELWAEATPAIKDGKTAAFTLTLVANPCPTIAVSSD